MPLTRQEIAADLKTAMLRYLPAKLRPKEADIAVMALLMAESPVLRCWVVERKGAGDFSGLNPP